MVLGFELLEFNHLLTDVELDLLGGFGELKGRGLEFLMIVME